MRFRGPPEGEVGNSPTVLASLARVEVICDCPMGVRNGGTPQAGMSASWLWLVRRQGLVLPVH